MYNACAYEVYFSTVGHKGLGQGYDYIICRSVQCKQLSVGVCTQVTSEKNSCQSALDFSLFSIMQQKSAYSSFTVQLLLYHASQFLLHYMNFISFCILFLNPLYCEIHCLLHSLYYNVHCLRCTLCYDFHCWLYPLSVLMSNCLLSPSFCS